MAAQVISFARRWRPEASRDWSNQELAEFYRVESALIQAGLDLESDRGLSDEGDPWFAFCRVDTGDVFVHFARVDGVYVVDGAAFVTPARGSDFSALVRDLIGRHPLAVARRSGGNVFIHPAALLIALVGAAFFHSGHAKAADLDHSAGGAPKSDLKRALTLNVSAAASTPAAGSAERVTVLDAQEVAAVLAGVSIGVQLAATAEAQRAATGNAELGAFALPRAAPLRPFADGGAAQSAALAHLATSDASAALVVMAVLRDLSPVTHTQGAALAAPLSPDGAAESTLAPPSDPHLTAAAALPSTSVPTELAAVAVLPGPQIVLHLAQGPLPSIAAIILVQLDGALQRLGPDHVLHLESLPAVLADAIAHGEIISPGVSNSTVPPLDGSASASVSPDGASDVGATNPIAAASGDHTHLGGNGGHEASASSGSLASSPSVDSVAGAGAALPPSTEASGPPSTTSQLPPASSVETADLPPAPLQTGPSSPTTDPTTPNQIVPSPSSVVVQPPAVLNHDTAIDLAIDSFTTSVKHVTVLVTDNGVVFYDPDALGIAGQKLDSVTWVLEDGSMVSLIGTVAELHAFHGIG